MVSLNQTQLGKRDSLEISNLSHSLALPVSGIRLIKTATGVEKKNKGDEKK